MFFSSVPSRSIVMFMILLCGGKLQLLPAQPQPIVVQLLESNERKEHQTVDLGQVVSGQRVKRRVRFENHCEKPLEIVSFVKTCVCIAVDLPSNRIAKQGEALEFDFTFENEKFSQNVKQQFYIQFETKGSRDTVTLLVDLFLKNHIAFSKADFYVNYAEKSGRTSFRVPIVISSDIRIQDLDLKFGEDIRAFVDGKIVEIDRIPTIECVVDTSKVSTNTSGILEIVRKTGGSADRTSVASCVLNFSEMKWVSVLPSAIVFRPVPKSVDFIRQAHAIMRIRTSSRELSELGELKCETSKGVRLPIEFTKVRDGFYRIVISTIHKDDLTSNDKLKISVATPNDRTDVFVEGILSNE